MLKPSSAAPGSESQNIFDILELNNIFHISEQRYYKCSLKGSNLQCTRAEEGFVIVPATVPKGDDVIWLSVAFEAPVTITASVPWYRKVYQTNK